MPVLWRTIGDTKVLKKHNFGNVTRSTYWNSSKYSVGFCIVGGRHISIVFDTFSKWMEGIKMKPRTASYVIEKLRNLYTTFGLPTQFVSDNGPPFTSREFLNFFKSNGRSVLK